jgi:hypothetical protein
MRWGRWGTSGQEFLFHHTRPRGCSLHTDYRPHLPRFLAEGPSHHEFPLPYARRQFLAEKSDAD